MEERETKDDKWKEAAKARTALFSAVKEFKKTPAFQNLAQVATERSLETAFSIGWMVRGQKTGKKKR